LISAALSGDLQKAEYETHEIFGVAMPTSCPGVPQEMLNPRNTWSDKDAYDQQANYLANSFLSNFEKFADSASEEILAGAPKVRLAV
jgi:phosphoenolpyruvate carboxykinase (ATP)